MKLLRKILILILVIVIPLSLFTSCSDTDWSEDKEEEEEKEAEETTYLKLKTKRLLNVERGESIPLEEKLVVIEQSFVPAQAQNGYVPLAQLSVEILGYDHYYTYFSSSVTVTWTYNEISEAYPNGVDKTFSTVIGLSPDGQGYYKNQISFEGARDIKIVSVEYSFDGTATRK